LTRPSTFSTGKEKAWMPGHRRAEATPFFERLCLGMTTHNANPIHPAFSREQPQSGPTSPFHSCRGSIICGKKWNLRFDRFETLKAGA
jgi:hypothetical protein